MAYSEEQIETIFNTIIEKIEEGQSVRSILREEKMPSRPIFYKWLKKDEEKVNQYAHATSARADNIFDEMFDIADDGTNDYISTDIGDGIIVEKINTDHIQRSRLRIDTRKWALSKMNPKKYGDKLDVTSDNEKLQNTTIIAINKDEQDKINKLLEDFETE